MQMRILLLLCAFTPSACIVSDALDEPAPDLESIEQPAVTMHRIPVRIIEAHDCDVGVDAGCAPYSTSREITDVFDRVNDVFAVAGLEFWVKSVEYVEAPTFTIFGISDELAFSAVRTELRGIVPRMPTYAFADTTMKSRSEWLNSGAALYGDPDEVLLLVHTGGKSAGAFPEKGRFLRVGAKSFHNDLELDSGFGSIVPHELGHYFGLAHIWQGRRPLPEGRNPKTDGAWTRADAWDLHRCGDSTIGFASKQAAELCSDVRVIETDNGGATDRFTPTLTIGRGTFDATDDRFPGVLFDLGGTHNPPDAPRWGINVMTYYSNYLTVDGEKLDGRVPPRISDSQAEFVRIYRDYDQPYIADARAKHVDGLVSATNVVANSHQGLRPELGLSTDDMLWIGNGNLTFASRTVPVSSTNYEPIGADLDGNGHTDIVWYVPSTGIAHLWFASGDGSFTHVNNVILGAGATLHAGDFDDDDRDELLVYRASSSSVIREWTGTGFDTRAVSSNGWTPVIGNFDGAFGDDIFWYSERGGNVAVWWSVGGTNMTATFLDPIAPGYQPFAGDFDGDDIDDVFMYMVGSSAPDRVWYGQAARTFDSRSVSVSGDYQPVVGDFDGDGCDDIIWENDASIVDPLWRSTGSRSAPFTGNDRISLHGTYRAIAGRFDSDAVSDVFWHKR